MEWFVFCEDINHRRVGPYNIFKHTSFSADIEKHLKACKTKAEFIEKVERSLSYYFWAKCEYEINMMSLFCNSSDEVEKVDVYTQVKLNWDRFIDYVWSFRK